MGKHSIAETKNKITELIARAERGEEIVITRHGREVAKIVALERMHKPLTQQAIDWLRTHRVGGTVPEEDAATTVRRMRDEDWAH